MLKYIALLFAFLSLAACSKDSNTIVDNEIQERADEVLTEWDLNVYVSYVDYSAATCEPIYMENTQVNLIEGFVNLDEITAQDIVMSRKTDESGKAVLESLERGKRTVYVSTEYGAFITHINVDQGVNTLINIQLVK